MENDLNQTSATDEAPALTFIDAETFAAGVNARFFLLLEAECHISFNLALEVFLSALKHGWKITVPREHLA
jgi:hypothetical protein